jgi:two-component system, cell cycle response regulator
MEHTQGSESANLPEIHANPSPSTMLAANSGKVLIIDDSVSVHRLLKARLSSEGLTLLEALDGNSGIEMAHEHKPDVILLDLSMPGLDGFQVLRQLKDDPAVGQIPVIVLSGMQSPQDKVTAFDLGAIDFIAKPFDLTELRVRVRSAIRLSELLQLLSQRAQIDGLTGLYNRAHFDRRWPEELAGATRHDRPISLAMIDLDHFKSINDTFGHPAGDSVIQALGRILQEQCRSSDIACRYGGEEFIIILPDTSPDAGFELCDRIRLSIAQITWPRHPERKVTCSIGLVGAEGSVLASPTTMIEAADKILYKAKQAGRNRVMHETITDATTSKAS